MPRIELLERDETHARYIVFDDDGREAGQTHRDVTKELAISRRKKISLVEAIAQTEHIVLQKPPRVAVIPINPDAPIATDHRHEEFDLPEPDRSHDHPEIEERLDALEPLLGHLLDRVNRLDQWRTVQEKHGHPHDHEDELEAIRKLVEVRIAAEGKATRHELASLMRAEVAAASKTTRDELHELVHRWTDAATVGMQDDIRARFEGARRAISEGLAEFTEEIRAQLAESESKAAANLDGLQELIARRFDEAITYTTTKTAETGALAQVLVAELGQVHLEEMRALVSTSVARANKAIRLELLGFVHSQIDEHGTTLRNEYSALIQGRVDEASKAARDESVSIRELLQIRTREMKAADEEMAKGVTLEITKVTKLVQEMESVVGEFRMHDLARWLAFDEAWAEQEKHTHPPDVSHPHEQFSELADRIEAVEAGLGNAPDHHSVDEALGVLAGQHAALAARVEKEAGHTHPRHFHSKDEWPEHDHPEVEHGHHWLLVSEEDTAGTHRRIWRCRDCGKVETHQGD